MPTFTTGAGLTGGTVLFPHERWMAGKMHLEVECYFRTSKLRGSVSITIRSDSTILSLKRCLLNSIEITHMECFPGNEVDMPFVMEDFKPLTFVLVADRNKELLYWRAEEDNVRIIQHEDFIASLQETYVRANVGKKKVKMHRKCLLLCCSELELIEEIACRRKAHGQRDVAAEIERIRTPSPDLIGGQTRPPPGVLPSVDSLLAELSQRWRPDPIRTLEWRQYVQLEASSYSDSSQRCFCIHTMMERIQAQSHWSSYLCPQTALKSQRIRNKALPKSHNQQKDIPPEP